MIKHLRLLQDAELESARKLARLLPKVHDARRELAGHAARLTVLRCEMEAQWTKAVESGFDPKSPEDQPKGLTTVIEEWAVADDALNERWLAMSDAARAYRAEHEVWMLICTDLDRQVQKVTGGKEAVLRARKPTLRAASPEEVATW